MCGISGFVYSQRPFDAKEAEGILSRMCDSLKHRGPDDRGLFLDGFETPQGCVCGLGHNRLSIIDLSSQAHQPMCNEDKSLWISYNGEIYNYRQLQDTLLGLGHVFSSGSDTEVLLHGWEQWQEGLFPRLNGMFAFAIWDSRRKELVFARDRAGKKPLYYCDTGKGMIFASEPKGIFQCPGVDRRIDQDGLGKYLLYEYVPAPNTIYQGVKRLPSASFLKWKDGNFSIQRYWDIDFSPRGPGEPGFLLELLKDSVRKRLGSDVPLGIFLSGGIDSSSVALLASELNPGIPVKTFSVGFADPSFDETRHSDFVAGFINSEHTKGLLDPGIAPALLQEIITFLDEPFADASIIPTYLVSKFTSGHVKTVLGGDGADELFAGYDTFPAYKLSLLYDRLPSFLRRMLKGLCGMLPVSYDNLSLDFRLKQFMKGADYPELLRNQVWLGSFDQKEQGLLIDPSYIRSQGADLFSDIHAMASRVSTKRPMDVFFYLYFCSYLQDDILYKVDRASMACSLEVRAPFLDYRLVEYAFGLPAGLKLSGLDTKYLLKKSLKGHLPDRIIERPKKGFGVPVGKWIRGPLRSWFIDMLSPERISRDKIFNPVSVSRLLDDHLKGVKDNRKQLWTLFMFELWRQRWMQ